MAVATVTVYNGSEAYRVTGTIRREYAKGLTVEDERGVIHYATFERVTMQTGGSDLLW